LAAQLPSGLSGRLVALIAHTAQGSGQLAIQPGTALQVGEIPDQPRLPALVHDCASGPGSAGAPVIDLDTGYVLGVHTHAKQADGGFAQPAWELARDPLHLAAQDPIPAGSAAVLAGRLGRAGLDAVARSGRALARPETGCPAHAESRTVDGRLAATDRLVPARAAAAQAAARRRGPGHLRAVPGRERRPAAGHGEHEHATGDHVAGPAEDRIDRGPVTPPAGGRRDPAELCRYHTGAAPLSVIVGTGSGNMWSSREDALLSTFTGKEHSMRLREGRFVAFVAWMVS
jgi:hypothetical protein